MSSSQVFVGVFFGDSQPLCSTSTTSSFRSHHFIWCYSILVACLMGVFQLALKISIGFNHVDPHHRDRVWFPQFRLQVFVSLSSLGFYHFLPCCEARPTYTSYLFNIDYRNTMFLLSQKHWRKILLLLRGIIGTLILSLNLSILSLCISHQYLL